MGVYTFRDNVVINEINHQHVMFSADGEIMCKLQWGSDSDLRRDDGVILTQSFPFKCDLISPVYAPESVEALEESLEVDTSTWHEGQCEE